MLDGGDAPVARLTQVLPAEDFGSVHAWIAHALDPEQVHGAASGQPLVLPHLLDARRSPNHVDLRDEDQPLNSGAVRTSPSSASICGVRGEVSTNPSQAIGPWLVSFGAGSILSYGVGLR